MNKLLAGTIRVLNALLAFFIFLFGVIVGNIAGTNLFHDEKTYTLLGAFLGFILALLICGILALFIEMRSELIKIRIALSR